jgi:hypothetical protein
VSAEIYIETRQEFGASAGCQGGLGRIISNCILTTEWSPIKRQGNQPVAKQEQFTEVTALAKQ